jgi:hypothetical protein
MKGKALLPLVVALAGCVSEKPGENVTPDSARSATPAVAPRDTVAERIARDTFATMAPDTCGADTTTQRTVETRYFTVSIPATARAIPRDSAEITSIQVDSFPGCAQCSLGGHIWPDTVGDGADGHIRRILREEARIDSLNNDPKTGVHEFNNYNPPARRVTGAGDSAIFIRGDCGDCLTESYFFGMPGRIAELNVTIDTGVGERGNACGLRRSALSFRWRR